jgi:hypothetical protein
MKDSKPSTKTPIDHIKPESKPEKISATDRALVMDALASGHESAIKILTEKMKGVSGAEKKMLQTQIIEAKALMLQCQDLADVARSQSAAKMEQQKVAAEISQQSPTRKRKIGEVEVGEETVGDKIKEAVKKINDNATLGFVSDVSVSKLGKSVEIKVEARMPEEFKGMEPTKMPTTDLNRARELMVNQSAVKDKKAAQPEHKDMGEFTHMIMAREEEKKKQQQKGGGSQQQGGGL